MVTIQSSATYGKEILYRTSFLMPTLVSWLDVIMWHQY